MLCAQLITCHAPFERHVKLVHWRAPMASALEVIPNNWQFISFSKSLPLCWWAAWGKQRKLSSAQKLWTSSQAMRESLQCPLLDPYQRYSQKCTHQMTIPLISGPGSCWKDLKQDWSQISHDRGTGSFIFTFWMFSHKFFAMWGVHLIRDSLIALLNFGW